MWLVSLLLFMCPIGMCAPMYCCSPVYVTVLLFNMEISLESNSSVQQGVEIQHHGSFETTELNRAIEK
jgi:hypothetical protein